MGVLSRVFERRALDWDPKWARVVGLGGGAETSAGVEVTPNSSLTYSAVFACVRVLAEDVGSLSLLLYRRLGRGKERAADHSLYRILHDAPNPEMTSQELRETLTGHVSLWGNGYAEIERDNGGRVIGLWPLRPDRVRPRRVEGRLVYEVRVGGETVVLEAWRVMHLRGLGSNGIVGYSPIALQRNAVGLGLATEEFGSRFFANGARPGLVLTHPGQLGAEGQENLRRSWGRQHEGLSRAHRIAVLEEGMTITQIGIPPEDAQFLETRRFQALEIARIFRVPPHMIGDLERATFSNIEHQAIQYVDGTLLPWLRRWELRIGADLLSEGEKKTLFAEHLVDGKLRGDTVTRYQAYMTGRQGGWLSVNDIRERENMNPVEGGDEYLQPLNMVAAGEQGSGGAGGEEGARGLGAGEERTLSLALSQGARGQEWRAVGAGRRRLQKRWAGRLAEAGRRLMRREAEDIRAQAAALGMRAGEQGGRGEGEKGRERRDAASELSRWLDEYYAGRKGEIARAMGEIGGRYAEEVAAAAAREVGLEELPELVAFVEAYAAAYAGRHAGKASKRVRAALADEDAAEALEEELALWEDERPAEMGHQESVRMGNATAKVVFVAAGVTKLVWDSQGTACSFCAQMDGVVVGIDEGFGDEELGSSVGHPPLHRGCKCQILAG
jgi:HK97 family phage portal protein